jgi:asparagine N-glycosylation enzyme membrane subunit Stt3
VLATVQSGAFLLLSVLVIALSVLALLDCVRRPAAAFPAVGRQSKVLWLILTGVSTLAALAWLRVPFFLTIAAIVISMIYLFDVRPKIKEITGR